MSGAKQSVNEWPDPASGALLVPLNGNTGSESSSAGGFVHGRSVNDMKPFGGEVRGLVSGESSNVSSRLGSGGDGDDGSSPGAGRV